MKKRYKIKIIKSRHATYWYSNRIGAIFEAELWKSKEDVKEWSVVKGQKTQGRVTLMGTYHIDYDDAVVIQPKARRVRGIRKL